VFILGDPQGGGRNAFILEERSTTTTPRSSPTPPVRVAPASGEETETRGRPDKWAPPIGSTLMPARSA